MRRCLREMIFKNILSLYFEIKAASLYGMVYVITFDTLIYFSK